MTPPPSSTTESTHLRGAEATTSSDALSIAVFGAPLGLVGLAGAWDAARADLHAWAWPAEAFAVAALALWLTYTVRYIGELVRRRRYLRADLAHPFLGPFTALPPMVAVLLAVHYGNGPAGVALPELHAAMQVVACASSVVLALGGAWLLEEWITGTVSADDVHPGYFIPVVAGPFVISIATTFAGMPAVATGAFGAGVFLWLVVAAVVTTRGISGGTPSAGQLPLYTAYLAAPGVAGLAWASAHYTASGTLGPSGQALTGVLVAMALLQVMLVHRYRRVPFSSRYWIFTFALASSSNYAVRLSHAAPSIGSITVAWTALVATTGFITSIAVRTALSTTRSQRARAMGRA